MKKILLLLSCFLATWCGSVQAQATQPYGIINDASYDATNSQINAHFTSRNAYKVEMGYISQHAGSLESPLYKKALGVIDGATLWATIDVDPNLEEGLYQVLLYLNGSKSVNGGNKPVNVTARAAFKGFSPNLDNTTLTVNYCLLHSSITYSYLKVYDGNTLLFNYRLPKYPNSFNGNYTFSSTSLKPGKTYTFKLYNHDKVLATKSYTIPLPTGKISDVAYSPSDRNITVDYVLKYDRKPTLKIYDHWTGDLVRSVAITNSASTKRINIKDIKLKDGYRYDVVICDNGVRTNITKDLSTTAVDTDGPTYNSTEIVDLGYNRSTNKIYVDFQLKTESLLNRPNGAKVEIKLMSTKQGTSLSNLITDGAWYIKQNSGRGYVTVPSESGNVLYIVFLYVNDEIAASKQIVVSR